MGWEVSVEGTLRTIAGIVGGWLAIYIKKRAVPFYKSVKKVLLVSDRVDLLYSEVGVLKSKQMAAINTATDPTFIMDTKGNWIYANPACGDMTGFTTISDAYGMSYLRAVHPEDIEAIERANEGMAEFPSSYEMDMRYVNLKTKQTVFTKLRTELVKDREGKVVEIIGRLSIIT